MNFINLEDVKNVKVSVEEAETVINMSRGDAHITIYTSDNTMLNKIIRAANKNKTAWKCWSGGVDSDGNVTGYFFQAPKKAITVKSGLKKSMSEEEIEAKRERMKNVHKNRRTAQNG